MLNYISEIFAETFRNGKPRNIVSVAARPETRDRAVQGFIRALNGRKGPTKLTWLLSTDVV